MIARVTIRRDASGKVVADQPLLIPTLTVESLGYQVLDARATKSNQFDSDVRSQLRKSLSRVLPYVGQFVPDSVT